MRCDAIARRRLARCVVEAWSGAPTDEWGQRVGARNGGDEKESG